MRVRLQLLAPFDGSKVLVSLPSEARTVSDLKKHIRTSLSSVLALSSSSRDLLLEVDGFELLAGSSLDIIESGDIVTVRLKAGTSKADSFRRRESVEENERGTKRRREDTSAASAPRTQASLADTKQNNPVPPVLSSSASLSSSDVDDSSSSSSSSSTSSTSSSALSSSASSSSSSSTSSSSGSSDDPASDKQQAQAAPPNQSSTLLHANGDQHHVVPGQGKRSTQDRNRRRKMAQQMKRLAEQHRGVPDAASIQEASTIEPANGDRVTPTRSELPVPSAMANRNKKKGFLKEMASMQGTKTVFGDDAQGSSTPLKQLEHGPDESHIAPGISTSLSSRSQTRVIPPSEKVLPSNVFVTHVEYERKGWTPRQRKSDNRRSHNSQRSLAQNEPVAGDEEEGEQRGENDLVGLNLDQSLGTAEPEGVVGQSENEWAVAESHFDSLPPLLPSSIVVAGNIVAWKELSLDPYTYTPQLAVQLGLVKSGDGNTVTLERLQRYEEENEGEAADREVTIPMTGLAGEPGKYKVVR